MTRFLSRPGASPWVPSCLRAVIVGLMLVAATLSGTRAQESRLANLAIRAEAAAGEPLIVGFNVGVGRKRRC